MTVFYILFYLSLFILFYNYLGYGILLVLFTRIKRLFHSPDREQLDLVPPVTLLVAAYNEADFIRQKIENCLALDYPEDKLTIIFITDGSSDGTPDIIREEPRVKLLHEPQRSGKTAAINRAMKCVQTPFVIFCDANTLLNSQAVRNIVRHYEDPLTGGVAGEKRVIANGDANAADTEGIYWKYESYLKKLDAELYSVVGAAGELFSIRTSLYQPVEENVILDDFVISLRINMKGYRIAYAPDAYAMEAPSFSITEEHKRKVRICAGGFQSIILLSDLLNIFKYPLLSFQYISHRVLRWTLSPLSMPILLISNFILVISGAGIFYSLMFAGQVLFYGMSIIGYLQAQRNTKSGLFYIPFYFVFMNLAVFQGFGRFVSKSQSAVWDKAKRSIV